MTPAEGVAGIGGAGGRLHGRLTRTGDYIFAPAHAVEGDAPQENMLAFIEVATGQEAYRPPGPAG